MERSRRPPRPSAEALASLESRLRSFLLVHEALRRQNYRGVPVNEIAEKLAQRLHNAWDAERRITLEFAGADITLGERQGFALALVLNELLTNAFRHAFPDGAGGTIRIRFAAVNGEFRLEVSDNGVGNRQENMSPLVGSGRSIVNALARDELGGRVESTSNDEGTLVTLAFPINR